MSARTAFTAGPVMGQSGLAFLPRVRILVERAHYTRGGVQWVQEGDLHSINELAQQAAEKLRKQGWRVRVRPIVL